MHLLPIVISILWTALACLNLPLTADGFTDTGCQETTAEKDVGGAHVLARVVDGNTIVVEWSPQSLAAVNIQYKAASPADSPLMDSGVQYNSPVTLGQLLIDTLYEIHFQGSLQSTEVDVLLFITTEDCRRESEVLMRQKREVVNDNMTTEATTAGSSSVGVVTTLALTMTTAGETTAETTTDTSTAGSSRNPVVTTLPVTLSTPDDETTEDTTTAGSSHTLVVTTLPVTMSTDVPTSTAGVSTVSVQTTESTDMSTGTTESISTSVTDLTTTDQTTERTDMSTGTTESTSTSVTDLTTTDQTTESTDMSTGTTESTSTSVTDLTTTGQTTDSTAMSTGTTGSISTTMTDLTTIPVTTLDVTMSTDVSSVSVQTTDSTAMSTGTTESTSTSVTDLTTTDQTTESTDMSTGTTESISTSVTDLTTTGQTTDSTAMSTGTTGSISTTMTDLTTIPVTTLDVTMSTDVSSVSVQTTDSTAMSTGTTGSISTSVTDLTSTDQTTESTDMSTETTESISTSVTDLTTTDQTTDSTAMSTGTTGSISTTMTDLTTIPVTTLDVTMSTDVSTVSVQTTDNTAMSTGTTESISTSVTDLTSTDQTTESTDMSTETTESISTSVTDLTTTDQTTESTDMSTETTESISTSVTDLTTTDQTTESTDMSTETTESTSTSVTDLTTTDQTTDSTAMSTGTTGSISTTMTDLTTIPVTTLDVTMSTDVSTVSVQTTDSTAMSTGTTESISTSVTDLTSTDQTTESTDMSTETTESISTSVTDLTTTDQTTESTDMSTETTESISTSVTDLTTTDQTTDSPAMSTGTTGSISTTMTYLTTIPVTTLDVTMSTDVSTVSVQTTDSTAMSTGTTESISTSVTDFSTTDQTTESTDMSTGTTESISTSVTDLTTTGQTTDSTAMSTGTTGSISTTMTDLTTIPVTTLDVTMSTDVSTVSGQTTDSTAMSTGTTESISTSVTDFSTTDQTTESTDMSTGTTESISSSVTDLTTTDQTTDSTGMSTGTTGSISTTMTEFTTIPVTTLDVTMSSVVSTVSVQTTDSTAMSTGTTESISTSVTDLTTTDQTTDSTGMSTGTTGSISTTMTDLTTIPVTTLDVTMSTDVSTVSFQTTDSSAMSTGTTISTSTSVTDLTTTDRTTDSAAMSTGTTGSISTTMTDLTTIPVTTLDVTMSTDASTVSVQTTDSTAMSMSDVETSTAKSTEEVLSTTSSVKTPTATVVMTGLVSTDSLSTTPEVTSDLTTFLTEVETTTAGSTEEAKFSTSVTPTGVTTGLLFSSTDDLSTVFEVTTSTTEVETPTVSSTSVKKTPTGVTTGLLFSTTDDLSTFPEFTTSTTEVETPTAGSTEKEGTPTGVTTGLAFSSTEDLATFPEFTTSTTEVKTPTAGSTAEVFSTPSFRKTPTSATTDLVPSSTADLSTAIEFTTSTTEVKTPTAGSTAEVSSTPSFRKTPTSATTDLVPSSTADLSTAIEFTTSTTEVKTPTAGSTAEVFSTPSFKKTPTSATTDLVPSSTADLSTAIEFTTSTTEVETPTAGSTAEASSTQSFKKTPTAATTDLVFSSTADLSTVPEFTTVTTEIETPTASTTAQTFVRVSSCAVVGDPHYTSFDGMTYNFMGSCEYKLASDCTSDTPQFEIRARNVVKPSTPTTATVDTVTVLAGTTVITMVKNGGIVLDGVDVTLPMFVPNVVSVQRAGAFTIVITSSGVIVQYDHNTYLSVRADDSFSGTLCGLCGNFNGDAQDDLTGASGSLQTVQNFGNSYITNPGQCSDIAVPVADPCLNATNNVTSRADDLCGILNDIMGEFASCIRRLPDLAETYYQNCRFDVCAAAPDEDDACSVILAFAIYCRQSGVQVGNWRTGSTCPVTCNANATYEHDGDPCPESCTSLLDPSVLTGCNSTGPVEGCQCDEGFVVEGDDCVLPETCGCIKDGFYSPAGSVFQTRSCEMECTCYGFNNLTCRNITCDENAECTPTGCSCLEGYVGDGFSCIVECAQGEFTCQDGSCIDAAKVCDQSPNCPDFSDESESLCCDERSSQPHCPGPNRFRCPSEGVYIPLAQVCDGYSNDCIGNFDEDSEVCSNLCKPPPSIASGYFTPVFSRYQTAYEITYVCSPGYTLVGNDTGICNGTQFGSTDLPTCLEDCDLPTAPLFGSLNTTDNTHGSVISLMCDTNYELASPGSYLVCDNGTLNGDLSFCQLIDLCLSDPCMNNGTCSNDVGFFTCSCTSGWMRDTCSENVDECSGTNDCDPDATCMDNPGSYTCVCNDGFTGDGFYCRETRLFTFGDEQGDRRLTQNAEAMMGDSEDLISQTFVPPAGFPIGDNFYYSLYFIENGIVVFINENGEKLSYPNAFPGGFDGSQPLVAVTPFWTDSNLVEDQGEVFYQVYEHSDMDRSPILDDADGRIRAFDAGRVNFTTSWMLVVTWYQISSFTSLTDTNTFQVGLATDGTFSYAIFSYEEDQMLWNVGALASTDVVIGFNAGSGMFANAQLESPLKGGDSRFRPDQFTGNTGLGGRWIYRLEANNETTVNPKQSCLDWYANEPPHEEWSENLGTCPCTFGQGDSDSMLRSENIGMGSSGITPVGGVDTAVVQLSQDTLASIQQLQDDGESFCLQTVLSPGNNLAGMKCCYRADGSLIEGFGPDAYTSSFAVRYNFRFGLDKNFLLLLLNLQNDYLPREACCGLSRDPYFCDLYSEKRPPGSCDGYLPPSTAWAIGDPHFTTMDGYAYTFNGLGDYYVALVYDDGEVLYEIQGRTQRVIKKETGLPGRATFFDAFSITDKNVTVTFILVKNGTDFTISVNNTLLNKTELITTDFQVNNVIISSENDNATKVTTVYESIAITVEVIVGVLDIAIQLPQSFRGNQTRGLIGIWNDDTSDDFTFPNGTTLAPNVNSTYSSGDIFSFGESWRVAAEDSLFDPEVNRRRRSLVDEANFEPIDLPNLISDFEMNDPSFLASARSICQDNSQCLFDALAAEDQLLGAATKDTEESNQATEMMLENFPPNITADSTIVATVGELFYYQVSAIDPEGGNISYSLGFDNITANISSGGLVTWNPISTDQISLVVQASDGSALSAIQPTIIICDCQNNGTCRQDTFTQESNVLTDKFAVAVCECTEAYSGAFCEEDFDACLDDPCFPGITCFDNVAPLTGNRCGDGTCPDGLVGNGFKCFDLDECVAYENRSVEDGGPACSQICENTLNGFTCSCFDGYNLHPDMYQCLDINECERETDDCSENAECGNLDGSYNCTCFEGYLDVDGDGRVCQDINECVASPPVCDSRATCDNTNGSFVCTCTDGFEGDGRSCSDIDECTRNLDDCDVNADCTNTEGSFTCTCQPGWAGDGVNCTNINECDDMNLRECHPRASCMDTEGSYICICPPGYIGDGVMCQDVDECQLGMNDCDGGGSSTCTNSQGSYECFCNNGYTGNGTVCEDIDECNLVNGTVCSDRATCMNTVGTYACMCDDGYLGDGITCMDIDECNGDNDCNTERGSCSNTEGSFECSCNTGYRGDGRNCTDIDECQEGNDCDSICNNIDGGFFCSCYQGYSLNPALPSQCLDVDECALSIDNCTQGCNNTDGGYDCYCFEGFVLSGDTECVAQVNCTRDICINGQCYYSNGTETCMCNTGFELSEQNDTVCEDIDECEVPGLNMCDQRCNNTRGGYLCSCLEGYRLAQNERSCLDIDECAEDLDDCDDTSSTCINEVGGFRCMCNTGFVRNGSVCQDIDECLGDDDCSPQGVCNNTLGSYTCYCMDGFAGTGFTCLDVDECLMSPCHEDATCNNQEGSFTCECNSGFVGNGTFCMDIDECEGLTNCSSDATCVNSMGSYICTCNDGYQGDGRICSDVDECSLPDSDPQAANCDPNADCENQDGSFLCLCPAGFLGNGTYCEDFNECDASNSCVVNSLCVNLLGSYQCNCDSGYRGDGFVSCDDVEECVENLDDCSDDATCTNFVGGFNCTCNEGYAGDGVNCTDINECKEANDCHPLADCTNNDGSYYCTCPSGYVSVGAVVGVDCMDFDECMLTPCGANQICVNTFGSFFCTCDEGFEDVNGTCSDIDECLTRPCDGITNSRCENTEGGFNCICQTGFYNVSGSCEVSKPFAVQAVFTDIKGVEVLMRFLPGNRDELKTQLQEDLVTLFEESGLPDFLGVTIRTCELTDEGLDLKFTADLSINTSVTIEMVERDFMMQLTGRDSNVVKPDSIILRNTLIVGDPVMNPCEEQTDNCTDNAMCIFLGSSFNYTCECNEGFMGDGFATCRDINECDGDPCSGEGEVCVNTDGGFTCDCRREAGYFQVNDECILFKAFQGQFTIIEVNEIAEDATFREVYSDSTSLEFTILENKVCESVRFLYLFKDNLQEYIADCFVDSFTSGSIQVIWTILFETDVITNATSLEDILVSGLQDVRAGDGILLTGTQTGGNLTIIASTVEIDNIVTECPDNYCNNGNCSVVQGSYVCMCPYGYGGSQCQSLDTTIAPEVTTQITSVTAEINPVITTKVTQRPTTDSTTGKEMVFTTTSVAPSTTLDEKSTVATMSAVAGRRKETTESVTTQNVTMDETTEEEESTTVFVITEEPDDGLELYVFLGIILGGASIIFLLMVCCFGLVICFGRRKGMDSRYPAYPHPRTIHHHHPSVSGRVARREIRGGAPAYYYDEYSDDESYDDVSIPENNFESEERLRQLARVISQSSYLNEHMRDRTSIHGRRSAPAAEDGRFFTPYTVSGHEQHIDHPRENPHFDQRTMQPTPFLNPAGYPIPRPQFHYNNQGYY